MPSKRKVGFIWSGAMEFADTAAAIQQLDVVVMADSSTAHLTASLGKTVIKLLNHNPYWIYGREGDSAPWYPTMHCLRQETPGDWSQVFSRMLHLV